MMKITPFSPAERKALMEELFPLKRTARDYDLRQDMTLDGYIGRVVFRAQRQLDSVPPPLATAARWTPAVPTCRWRWPGTGTLPRPAARGPWKRSPLSMRKATAAQPTAPLPMPAVKP